MSKRTLRTILRDIFGPVAPLINADLTGRAVLVVGANVGLGYAAAKHYASMNPDRLILACRSLARGEAAISRECSRG
jgi:retinol dehydrogenase 12